MAFSEAVSFVKRYPIALCGFSLLFMPSVHRLLLYFTPLLLSTSIFVVAMLTSGSTSTVHPRDADSDDADADSDAADAAVAVAVAANKRSHSQRLPYDVVGDLSGGYGDGAAGWRPVRLPRDQQPSSAMLSSAATPALRHRRRRHLHRRPQSNDPRDLLKSEDEAQETIARSAEPDPDLCGETIASAEPDPDLCEETIASAEPDPDLTIASAEPDPDLTIASAEPDPDLTIASDEPDPDLSETILSRSDEQSASADLRGATAITGPMSTNHSNSVLLAEAAAAAHSQYASIADESPSAAGMRSSLSSSRGHQQQQTSFSSTSRCTAADNTQQYLQSSLKMVS